VHHSKLVLLFGAALVMLFAAGCGSDTGAANADNTAAVVDAEKVVVPEGEPALVGKVKEIVGNEVTVYIAEMPAGSGGIPVGNRQPIASGEAPPDNQAQRPQAPRAGFKVSEETETFIIPVGTPLATVQRGAGEAARTELSEIKKEQFIRVWKKDEAIVFVQIMAMPGNRQDAAGDGEQRPANMVPPGAGGMGGQVFIGGGRQP